MNLDYNAIAAWSGLATAVIAIIALLLESRRSRFSQAVDLILRLEERFTTEPMVSSRRRAAIALRSDNKADADDVLDFLEMIGLLMRRGALDETMVWHTFFYWIHRYSLAANSYIRAAQTEDPTRWEELVRLHRRVVDVEKRKRGCSNGDLQLSPEDLLGFLEEEATL
jgi:hypothetical protein